MAEACVESLQSERSLHEVSRKKLERSNCNKMNVLLEKLPVLGEIFDLHYKIGEGTFSNVYLASSKAHNEKGFKDQFAVKHLIPTCHPTRIVRELKCLQEIGGVDNVAGIFMCLRMNDCITFVMPYQPHDRFITYVTDMTIPETQMYLKQLLIALRRVHKFGVIHRDVKPSNFLYSRKEKRFLLVDFGLAQKLGEWNGENGENMSARNKKRKRADEGENQEPTNDMPPVKRHALQNLSSNIPLVSHKNSSSNLVIDQIRRLPLGNRESNITFLHTQQVKKNADKLFAKPMITPLTCAGKCNCDGKPQICHKCLTRKAQAAPRAGTPGFRPPEVLLKYPQQTTAVDMWAVGVIMLCILSRTYPFFRSPDDVTALAEMITLFGSDEVKNVANRLGRNIVCSETRKPLDLKKLCEQLSERKGCKEKYPESAFSLMSKLLDLDPFTRITAEEALKHPFIAEEFVTL
ncbi:cdc7 kinase isoform X1 [Rhodnius prolixus]